MEIYEWRLMVGPVSTASRIENFWPETGAGIPGRNGGESGVAFFTG